MCSEKPLEAQNDSIVTGNAYLDGEQYRTWFIGHFVGQDQHSLRRTRHVEVQLRQHPKGNRKQGWSSHRSAHSLVLLIRGHFVLEFPHKKVELLHEGDYSLWPPGVPHTWEAKEDTLVVTVRWPSLSGDAIEIDPHTHRSLPE